jgi:N-acetylneuraminic acid mutarotase
LIIACISNISFAGEWVKKADIPAPRWWIGAVAVNKRIYVIGGCGNGFVVFSTTFEYDPLEDQWIERANMPTARDSACLSVIDGKIYALGGMVEQNGPIFSTVEMYDPNTDKWTKKADMFTPKQEFTAGVANGKIYVFGGAWAAGIPTVEEYDPIKDKWIKKGDMPIQMGWGPKHAPTVNGKIYVIGGWKNRGGPGLSTVIEYDPGTDSWIKKADMPTARAFLAVTDVSGMIYAIGGGETLGSLLSTVEKYDPLTDTWSKVPNMQFARGTLAASSLNGKIYAIGGWTGNTVLSTVEEYDTGFKTQNVNIVDKITSTWGNIKAIR